MRKVKTIALRNAIKEGLDSAKVEDFDFDENLKTLKAEKQLKLFSDKNPLTI